MWSVLIQVAAVGRLTLLPFSFDRFKNMAKTSRFGRNPGTCQPSLNLDEKKWNLKSRHFESSRLPRFTNILNKFILLPRKRPAQMQLPRLSNDFMQNAACEHWYWIQIRIWCSAEVRELLWGQTEAKMVQRVFGARRDLPVCSTFESVVCFPTTVQAALALWVISSISQAGPPLASSACVNKLMWRKCCALALELRVKDLNVRPNL